MRLSVLIPPSYYSTSTVLFCYRVDLIPWDQMLESSRCIVGAGDVFGVVARFQTLSVSQPEHLKNGESEIKDQTKIKRTKDQGLLTIKQLTSWILENMRFIGQKLRKTILSKISGETSGSKIKDRRSRIAYIRQLAKSPSRQYSARENGGRVANEKFLIREDVKRRKIVCVCKEQIYK